MANGRILISKPSGGVTTVTSVDGVENTTLILPESGTLLTSNNITESSIDTTTDRLLKVGDFGAGVAVYNASDTDLNNPRPAGKYVFINTALNLPTPHIYYVDVYRNAPLTGYNYQVAFCPQTGVMYRRSYNGTVWSTWAEICDTSEEGTFTPRIYGSTTAGVGTYSSQVGTYERLGNQIHFNIYLSTTAHTGTGTIRIDGLPYVPSLNYNAVTIGYISNFTFTGNVVAYADNTGVIYLTAHTSGAATPSGITMDTSFVLVLSGTYRIP